MLEGEPTLLHHEVHQLHRPLAHVVPQSRPTRLRVHRKSGDLGGLMAAQVLPLGTAALECGSAELQVAIVGIRLMSGCQA